MRTIEQEELLLQAASQETCSPFTFSSHCDGQEKLHMKTQNNRTNHFHSRNKPLRILSLLFLISTVSSGAVAQKSAAGTGITVRVTDPQGAIVRKAAVTLYTRDNRIRIKGVTDDSGTYLFAPLAPDEYLIEAEAAGFARSATRVLRIRRNVAETLDISLPLAGINEQVVVTA